MDWSWVTGGGWVGVAQVVARTCLVYLALIVLMRLAGARELGQMRPTDLVLLLLISNAVQNAMVGPDTSLLAGLAAAVVLVASNWSLNRLRLRSGMAATLLGGQPLLLIHDGAFVEQHLRHAGMTPDDALMALREHGIDRVEQVASAVLEVDGTISVIGRDARVVHSNRRVRRARKQQL